MAPREGPEGRGILGGVGKIGGLGPKSPEREEQGWLGGSSWGCSGKRKRMSWSREVEKGGVVVCSEGLDVINLCMNKRDNTMKENGSKHFMQFYIVWILQRNRKLTQL